MIRLKKCKAMTKRGGRCPEFEVFEGLCLTHWLAQNRKEGKV